MEVFPDHRSEDKASFKSLLVAGAGLAVLVLTLGVALCLRIVPLVADACLEVCKIYPPLMERMDQVTPVTIAMTGLFILPILTGTVGLATQLIATRGLLGALKDRRGILPSKLRRAAKGVGLDLNRLDHVQDGNIFAFCHGFLFPRICVSRGLVQCMSREELEAVLLHEAYHLRQRDPLRMLVSRSLSYALFFLPIVRYFAHRYLVHRELAADAWALRRVGRRVMARAFLKVIGSDAGFSQPRLAAVGWLNITAERLQLLLHPETASSGRTPAIKLAVSIVVAAGLIGGVGLFLLNPARSASAEGPICALKHPTESSSVAACCRGAG